MTVSHRKARASNAAYYLRDANFLESSLKELRPDAMGEVSQVGWLIRGCTNEMTKALLKVEEGPWRSERDADLFLSFAAGFALNKGADAVPLVQNAGSRKRVALHDFTLSAPKSVSVVWALSDEPTRRQIEQVQIRASYAFVTFLGDEVAYSRQGCAGRYRAPCSVVAALFPHFISRCGDPQLHSHCVMLNVAVRFDGTTGGLETRGMMRLLGVAATQYHSVLADGLQQLGFRLRQRGRLFEIDGVPVDVCEAFSQRRTAALAEVRADGVSEKRADPSRRRMRAAILKTRPRRRVYLIEELREQWAERARALKFELPVPALLENGSDPLAERAVTCEFPVDH